MLPSHRWSFWCLYFANGNFPFSSTSICSEAVCYLNLLLWLFICIFAMLYCLPFSPLGPPLFYIEFLFLLPLLSLASLKAQSCKVLSTRNKQQRLLSPLSGLQLKREIQTICICKTFAGREQEEGGAVTHAGSSPASPAAPDLFLLARTAGATGPCVWWGCVEVACWNFMPWREILTVVRWHSESGPSWT